MLLSNILLFTADPASKSGGGLTGFIPLLLIIVIFYLFFIRPQVKRNKEQKKFREALKKGDKIITVGGIHGKILELGDTTVIIETEGQGKLKVEKSSVVADTTALMGNQ